MIVEEFRFLSVDDKYDSHRYQNWSRPYEYKIVNDYLDTKLSPGAMVHNSAWGSAPIHLTFRNKLDEVYKCTHSDITGREDTYRYNILSKDASLVDSYDAVLNVSVLEHLGTFHQTREALSNLYEHLKPGGYLICTFDYPRVDLQSLEQFLNVDCKRVENPLTGNNSICPDPNINLNIVFLVIKRPQ
jgi:SAM-dependent methyltransferase